MKRAMMLCATLAAASACGASAKKDPVASAAQPAGAPAQPAPATAQPGADIKLPPASAEKLSPVERKLDAPLLELVRTRSQEPGLVAWSAKHQLPAEKGRVAVDVTCRTPQQADLVEQTVKEGGGELVARFENIVYAKVAPDQILTLAKMAEVWTVAASRKTIGR